VQQAVIDNRYTIVKPLGGGGMAQVHLAHDEVLGRDVAIKILRGQYADDAEFVERFRQEARSAASLSHPNIVPVYDQGRSEDGSYYMAMEYVPRGTLKDWIKREGALAPEAAAGVALQIANALQVAHAKGVIHRDIKPQNVLVTSSGDVKVADFGIARAAAASTQTRTGLVLGTAGYMSPEQAKGEPVGPGSDLYSLGIVLYEMLTGNLPYNADSVFAQAMKHVNEPSPSPKKANPEVPEALDALTIKLLGKHPEDRYPSAAALANDLERELHSGFTTAAGQEKTQAATAPLLPSPEERTRRTAARPPAAVPKPVPGGDGRLRGRLLPVLAALLLVVVLLGALAFSGGFFEGFDQAGSGGSNSTSSAEDSGAENTKLPDLDYGSEAVDTPAAEGIRNWSDIPSGNASTGEVIDQRATAGNIVEVGTDVVGAGPVQNPTQVSGSADSAVSGSTPSSGGASSSPPSPPPSPPSQATPEAPTQQPNAAPNKQTEQFKSDKEHETDDGEDEVAEEGCQGPVCLID
jgi:serine/threonine-protein kinase